MSRDLDILRCSLLIQECGVDAALIRNSPTWSWSGASKREARDELQNAQDFTNFERV
jgi:hypothetical protein